MCTEASPAGGCAKTSCRCGGHRRKGAPRPAEPDPRTILALDFTDAKPHACNCGHTCPRHYLAITGYLLGGFLLLHLALNTLALWPGRFQAAVNQNHALGWILPVLETGLIFIPLA